MKISLQLLLWFVVPQARAVEAGASVTEPLSFSGAFQVIGGLLAVLLVFAGVAYLLKRMTGLRESGAGRIRIIDGLMLSTRDRLVLVQIGKTELLLGVTPGRIEALHVFKETDGHTPFPAALDQEMTRQEKTRLDIEIC